MTTRSEIIELTARRLEPEAWAEFDASGEGASDVTEASILRSLKQAERLLPVLLNINDDFDCIRWGFERTAAQEAGALPFPRGTSAREGA